MTSKLSNETTGKKIVDLFTAVIQETRRTFESYSYDELKKAYNLSDKEIESNATKYVLSIKATDLAIDLALTYFVSKSNIKIPIKNLAKLASDIFIAKGIRITTKQITDFIMKKLNNKAKKMVTEETRISPSDIMMATHEETNEIKKQIDYYEKERLYPAIAAREVDRYLAAGKLADKDEDFLLPITTKHLIGLSSEHTNNMCKGDYVCIDEEKFRKKYPNGDIKIARERLSRFLNFRDNYKNPNWIARTNYYLKPFTKSERPYSNGMNKQQNKGHSR
jgi:hypothetical protein